MRPEDWLERWESGHTPFHAVEVNPLLQRFAGELLPTAAGAPRRVLVPLCGKSVDMAWLAARGHEVVGVELSIRALQSFFAGDENEHAYREEDAPPFRVLRGVGVTLYAGDFLDAAPEILGTFDAVWDRAALVALDPESRRRYARRVRSLMRSDARMLLVTLDYDRAEMDGPPFAVNEAEVAALYADLDVRVLDRDDSCIESEGRLAEAGLSRLTRTTVLLTPRFSGVPA